MGAILVFEQCNFMAFVEFGKFRVLIRQIDGNPNAVRIFIGMSKKTKNIVVSFMKGTFD